MRAIFHHMYFLPWLGYFSKLEYADAFIILDDVGFRRNHLKRVRIFDVHGNAFWLSIPVGNNWAKMCMEIGLPKDDKYFIKMMNTFKRSYGRAEYFESEFPILHEILFDSLYNGKNLIDANFTIFRSIRSHLKLEEKLFYYSSQFNHFEDRTQRIINICKSLNIHEILIGDGQMSQVHDLGLIKANGIQIVIQKYMENHPKYYQIHSNRNGKPFVKGLSIVDALFNIGPTEVIKLFVNRDIQPSEYII